MSFARKVNRQKGKSITKDVDALLKLAYDRGFAEGQEVGVKKAIDYLEEKVMQLEGLKGVGLVTAMKVAEHLGFERIKGDK